jgi:hypothetical protein
MIPDKLFINLKILSKVQKNGRICRSSNGIIALENETFYQSIKRFMTSDSRQQSVFEINSIINETIECMSNLVNSKYMNKQYNTTDEYYKNCEILHLILTELSNAKCGIENLKFTYSSDPNITSQLDILIVKINSSLKDMKYKLDYFNSFLPDSYKLNIQNKNPDYYIHKQLSPPNSYSDVQVLDNTWPQNTTTNPNYINDINNMNDINNINNMNNMNDINNMNNMNDINNMNDMNDDMILNMTNI